MYVGACVRVCVNVWMRPSVHAGPAWLSGKVFDSSSRGPGYMNNVSCRRDMTEILLKAA